MNQKLRLENIDKTINYFLEEIEQKNIWVDSTKEFVQLYIIFEHFLILLSRITGCISISALASLLGTPIEITTTAIELRILTLSSRIKRYKSTVKKKKKKHGKIILSAKSKINSMEV